MLVGYVRSTVPKDLEEQVTQLKALGCSKIMTRSKADPHELQVFLKSGDVLVVTKLIHLAQSVMELHDIVEALHANNIGLKVTEQADIDTTAKSFVDFLSRIADFERDLIKARCAEGREKAKLTEDQVFDIKIPNLTQKK
jgi:DNA invertase Pin-like site-specific DNA recombinase